MKITFGNSERENVCIEVRGYELADPRGDHLDDNWLVVDVYVSVGEFRGVARGASILTDEFAAFSKQLHTLYNALDGSAEFLPLEGHLSLTLTGDGRGHIQLQGELYEHHGTCCRLSFQFAFDQTDLNASLGELDSSIAAFPVRNTTA